jgi:hypothetical protein
VKEARRGVSMLWWRYPRWAGRLMMAWFLLSLVTGPVVSVHVSNGASVSHPGVSILTRLVGWAFSAFFAWRVTRGGRISRMLLILVGEVGVISLVIALAIQFRLAELGMLALLAAQVALLLSPAVYRRTRPGGQPGASVALWRRRTPPRLTAALAAGAVLGLAGAAVSAAMISGRVNEYDTGIVRVQPGHQVSVILSAGHYGAFGGCEDGWGCEQIRGRNLSVLGTRSGVVTLVPDGPYDYERTFAGQLSDRTATFTVPVRESVRFALRANVRQPVFIALVQGKANVVRGWAVTAAGFGLLLLCSLAGLAWPVSRRIGEGRW